MATIVTMPKLGFDMAEGTLVRWVRGIGETVQKGEVLAEIETDKATVEVEAVESGGVRKHLVQGGGAGPGRGPGGRVTKTDVAAALRRPAAVPPPGSIQPAPGLLPRPEKDEFISPTRLRQAVSRRMSASKQQVPHFYLTADLDAAQLVRTRAEANAALPEDTRLSIHDFVLRAAALALRAFPALNP